MKIIIGGDLVPTKSNELLFQQKDFLEKLDSKFVHIWNNTDFRIFNLECPLGENLSPIFKSGPNLLASSKTIEGICSLNPSLICLANNHILDYGYSGLKNTTNLLLEKNVKFTGIIPNKNTQLDSCILETNEIKIGIYNLCENEFSVATDEQTGANPLNEVKNCKEMQELKSKCDKCIVIFHGGKEYYRYPTPNLQRICRNFIDFGADVVILQHSHCIGCEEKYKNGIIIYGQGNFIFDGGNDEFWNTAVLVLLDIEKNAMKIDYKKNEKKSGLIEISDNKNILNDFWKRSREIKDEDFIHEQYKKFALKKLNEYLNISNKVRFSKKILNRLFKRQYFYKTYNAVDCVRLLNIIECEAHRELFIEGLKEKISAEKK